MSDLNQILRLVADAADVAALRGNHATKADATRAASGDDDLFPGLVIRHANAPGTYEIERQAADAP